MGRRWRKHAGIARRPGRAVPCPLRSRVPRRPRRCSQAERDRRRIEADLQEVESLDEDRILRRFVNAVHRRRCAPISIRPTRRPAQAARSLSSSKAASSTTCRCRGRCARSSSIRRASKACICASARWRAAACAGPTGREDFRTEVLGLVKAQQVKNAVIVPVGAKGGFCPKQLPTRRRPRGGAGRRHRRLQASSSRALLDITDNHRRRRRRAAARDVVRHDGDDPYLVVAADKGTATFSDIANAHRRSSTASGWATPSPPAARPATTTRRWASPRAAPGKRSSATSARWTSTSRPTPFTRRRRRRHVGRRVRQRHAAVAGRSGWSRPSTTATSSSIPIPIRQTSFAERAAPVRAAALELGGLRQGADLQGRRRLPARAQGDPAVAGDAQALLGLDDGRGDAARADAARS